MQAIGKKYKNIGLEKISVVHWENPLTNIV
jgi:hypothetical protein